MQSTLSALQHSLRFSLCYKCPLVSRLDRKFANTVLVAKATQELCKPCSLSLSVSHTFYFIIMTSYQRVRLLSIKVVKNNLSQLWDILVLFLSCLSYDLYPLLFFVGRTKIGQNSREWVFSCMFRTS